MTNARHDSGFSLAEVIVAFAILSLALVAIFKSYGLVVRGTVTSEHERHALAIAQSLLATTGVTDRLQSASDSGTLADGTVWNRTISAYGPASAPNLPPPYLITIEIATPGTKQPRSVVSLSTLKLAPGP